MSVKVLDRSLEVKLIWGLELPVIFSIFIHYLYFQNIFIPFKYILKIKFLPQSNSTHFQVQ
jgi:hypothetical protein